MCAISWNGWHHMIYAPSTARICIALGRVIRELEGVYGNEVPRKRGSFLNKQRKVN
jgi:hypothetical protein